MVCDARVGCGVRVTSACAAGLREGLLSATLIF